MKNFLFGLLNTAAVTSSAILDDGKKHLAESIGNNASYWAYTAMGVGNDTNAATANDSGIQGNISYYAHVNGSYEASNKAVFVHTFNYSDMGSEHIFREAVVAKNGSESDHNSLARIVYDAITLNLSDQLEITMKINFP